MKIIVTGSLGNISQPLTRELLEKGHSVTVISSSPDRQMEIQALGATAAIGSLEDADFLTETFTGADAVYTMVPPANYFDQNLDLLGHYHKIGNNYAQAIGKSGIKRVVNLSTIGGHLDKNNGILLGAHDVEEILNKLSADVNVTQMRPVYFYYNLLNYIETIKAQGMIFANYGKDKFAMVAPKDIAAAIAEEIVKSESENKVRYVVSDERTGDEVAEILGNAIGKPDLKWVTVSDEQVLDALKSIGMQPKTAEGMVEMYSSMNSGLLMEDYEQNKPSQMGKVKFTEYAKEFAEAFMKTK